MSKDLQTYIPLGARNIPSKQATFNLRETNAEKLTIMADEFQSTKSGIMNALIAKEYDNLFETEDS